jgi:sodium/bile acid cotransporter 7
VALIFLVSGMSLPPRKLLQTIPNGRLHVLAQGICFAVIPAIVLGV